jgi:hypothetical protein
MMFAHTDAHELLEARHVVEHHAVEHGAPAAPVPQLKALRHTVTMLNVASSNKGAARRWAPNLSVLVALAYALQLRQVALLYDAASHVGGGDGRALNAGRNARATYLTRILSHSMR